MEYFISFLEGMITFISPCLLPMIPIYITYFTGQDETKSRALPSAFGFVTGFTLVFVLLGAFAGSLGMLLQTHTKMVNMAAGAIMILFGLNYMQLIRIPFLNQNARISMQHIRSGFLQSMLLGIVFSISWSPCVGAFLGSALMLAASSAESIKGILMLLCFSMGLGIPFILSAMFIEKLKTSFDFIKRHYHTVQLVSGIFLIAVGVMMITGMMGYLLRLLTF